jgi:hypothetical protein
MAPGGKPHPPVNGNEGKLEGFAGTIAVSLFRGMMSCLRGTAAAETVASVVLHQKLSARDGVAVS